ncbi:hypothetical protein BJQ97_01039 [Geobacillus sp. TFV-3]|nr:hypothetical protein BJQ97_01039 [Geobacillus sp. TFV-3]
MNSKVKDFLETAVLSGSFLIIMGGFIYFLVR